ncbi:hypothetical protein HII17_12895 [Thalassotalea sp. M1531]|uniref:YchJ-like middle NTF2-like domain-containing protein n=2 Tax=Thalassotalea algicola TaxID=2716224 RepID=A0A7Y0LEZ8_9GAMM|nr:hypothetical protein [Thalassotalea algicola]
MRARFSAYATGYAQYILKTYANEKQQELTLTDIEEGIDENTWIKLSIHHASELFHPATVEFSAFYIHKSGLFEMREISRFIKEDEQWRYLNGDIVKHEEISKIKRNDSCPCNSGKKFKKCCSN